MIIDADCHISPEPQPGSTQDAEGLLRQMDAAGVGSAVVWLQPPYARDRLPASNRYVYDSARRHPDRLIPFGWADPSLGVASAVDEAKRCLEEYGFPGVKLNGAQNAFTIDDERVAMPVIEAVASRGGMLAFHVGCDAVDQTSPWRLANVARRFPSTAVLMVHIGGVGFHDMSRLAVDCVRGLPNVYAIGSAVRPAGVLYAIRGLGAERVLFGSDAPFEFMDVELAKYRALLKGRVPESAHAAVLGGNAARLLRGAAAGV